MKPRIRVLIAEDSRTVRGYLRDVLAADPELEVVGEAEDGRAAIERCRELRPDVVTLDMMLPVMSGLAATEYIMAHFPTPILIVSSSTNRGELFKTYDALAAGAVDVLEKPQGDEAEKEWERRFISAVKLVSRIKVITHLRARLRPYPAPLERVPGPSPERSAGRIRAIGVGASTGGPRAVIDVLRALPPDYAIPILLVVHIGRAFGAAFADWLDGETILQVAYGRDGDVVTGASGRVFMAPPDLHMTVRDGRIRLSAEAPRHSCRPSVDVLFESIASEYGPGGAGCLLTGMGRDGAAGLLQIRRAGGLTIAQDETSSVVYGMPKEAVLLGAAQHVLPIHDVGAALARLNGRVATGKP